MVAWILLIVLIAGEAAGFAWWLRKEFYPVFFSGWAALIYSAILAADIIAAWLVSMLLQPGGSTALAVLSIIGVALVVVVFGMTVFFRWLISHDMTDLR